MAKGTMANYTGKIMWQPPRSEAGMESRRVNGADIFPGAIVTASSETDPDVDLPGGNDEVSYGVALDRADKDIDTVFSDNDWIICLKVRSGGGAWVFVDDDEGAIEPWTAVYNTGADGDGYVEVLQVTAAPTTYLNTTIQAIVDYLESHEHRYVGRAATYQADQGTTDVPLKVLLV